MKKYKVLAIIIIFLCLRINPVKVQASYTVSGNELEKIEFSTIATDTFSYIMDPQELIKKTNAVKYGGATFSEGNLFFKNEDMRYSNISNPIVITNHSLNKIEANIRITLQISDEITLVDNARFEDEKCSLYLALKSGYEEIPILKYGDIKYAEFKTIIPASNGEEGNSLVFCLTGACNSKGNWALVSNTDSVLDITWTVTPIVENQFVEYEEKITLVNEKENESTESTTEQEMESTDSIEEEEAESEEPVIKNEMEISDSAEEETDESTDPIEGEVVESTESETENETETSDSIEVEETGTLQSISDNEIKTSDSIEDEIESLELIEKQEVESVELILKEDDMNSSTESTME